MVCDAALSEDGNREEVRNEKVEREQERFEELGVEGNGEEHLREECTREEECGKEECSALGEARDEVGEHENRGEPPAHHGRGYEKDSGQKECKEVGGCEEVVL